MRTHMITIAEFYGPYETWSELVSKMPCGRTYVIPHVGTVHAFRNKRGRRSFSVIGSLRSAVLSLDAVRSLILQASASYYD